MAVFLDDDEEDAVVELALVGYTPLKVGGWDVPNMPPANSYGLPFRPTSWTAASLTGKVLE